VSSIIDIKANVASNPNETVPPIIDSSTEEAISASLGAVLIPFPTRGIFYVMYS